jgi:hypothetical protein
MWLFRRRRPQPVERPWIEVSCGGEFELEVHGESFHQPLLRELVRRSDPEVADERIRATFKVALRREPENPRDPNAVAVLTLAGDALGHLPRELAAAYSKALTLTEQRYQVCCDAAARGRRIGRDWNIGIWLAMPDADQLVALLADAVGQSGPHAPGDLMARRELDGWS